MKGEKQEKNKKSECCAFVCCPTVGSLSSDLAAEAWF